MPFYFSNLILQFANLKRRNISATNSNTSTISSASEIRKYKELLDDGIITEEEFNKKKQELLDL